MKGYKAFNPDLTCLGYQFTANRTHIYHGKPILCKQGFHFCTTLEDIVKYSHQPDMRVFEIEAGGTITGTEDDCSKRACSEIRLIKEISLNEVMFSITKPQTAYLWAKKIGDKDIMINRIANRITESKWAYEWARDIGNQDIMINYITDSQFSFWWAEGIGNQDIMIDRITESEYAYKWAKNIGNKDIMKPKVTEPYWIKEWNYWFTNDEIK